MVTRSLGARRYDDEGVGVWYFPACDDALQALGARTCRQDRFAACGGGAGPIRGRRGRARCGGVAAAAAVGVRGSSQDSQILFRCVRAVAEAMYGCQVHCALLRGRSVDWRAKKGSQCSLAAVLKNEEDEPLCCIVRWDLEPGLWALAVPVTHMGRSAAVPVWELGRETRLAF